MGGDLLLRVLLKVKLKKAWRFGGTIQMAADRRKTCRSANVYITHPPGNGSSFNPDRLRHGTYVKAKNHVPCLSKIQLSPHRKHSLLYKEQPGRTIWRYSRCVLQEPDATETHRAAFGQIQRFYMLEWPECLPLPLLAGTTWPLVLCT